MESKKVEIGGRTFILNKIPAFQSQKIAFTCFAALKAKDLNKVPEETILQLCSYIGVENGSGVEIRLTDEEMININVKDSGVLMLAELSMLEYNYDFFFDGSLSKEIGNLMARLGAIKEQAETQDFSKA